jgi:hypothetical protein
VVRRPAVTGVRRIGHREAAVVSVNAATIGFGLRWIVRPLVFVLPLIVVAQWCDIEPTWKIAALTFFCIFWADAAHLFGSPADVASKRTVAGRRGRTARRWLHWDFEDFEAAMRRSVDFTLRAVVFAVPVLIVAWWADTSLGWKLTGWIAFCAVWDHWTDRIGKQDAA